MSQSFTGGTACTSSLCGMSVEEITSFEGDVDRPCGYEINTPFTHTALHKACADADLDKMQALLSRGADPNTRTAKFDGSQTPLHKLVQSFRLSSRIARADSPGIVGKLARKFRRSEREESDGPAEYSGAFLGDAIQILVAAGADVNKGTISRDYDDEIQRYTALHYIASRDPIGWKGACDVLLSSDASLAARTAGGMTPAELGEHVNPDGRAHRYLRTQMKRRGISTAKRPTVKILHALTQYQQTLNVHNRLKRLGFTLETTEGHLGPQFMNRAVIYEEKDEANIDEIFKALEPLEFAKYYKRTPVNTTPDGAIVIFMR